MSSFIRRNYEDFRKIPIVKKKNKKWFQTYSKNLYENLKIQWARKRKEEDNMLNQVVMVGRLMKEPTKEELVISISRNYKNKDGLYDSDIVKVYHNMPSIIEQNIHEGDLVGINGRLETENNEIKIKAEKITF